MLLNERVNKEVSRKGQANESRVKKVNCSTCFSRPIKSRPRYLYICLLVNKKNAFTLFTLNRTNGGLICIWRPIWFVVMTVIIVVVFLSPPPPPSTLRWTWVSVSMWRPWEAFAWRARDEPWPLKLASVSQDLFPSTCSRVTYFRRGVGRVLTSLRWRKEEERNPFKHNLYSGTLF